MSPRSKRYLVIIPARGGSKRLPGKNLMKIGENPLIGRAILGAVNSGLDGDICVSTDDQTIADEALRYGPYVPFIRPERLATDEAKTLDVVMHAVDWFSERGSDHEAVIVLQPTSPLRTAHHLREAVELFERKKAEAVVSVCKLEHPLQWCAELGRSGTMENFGQTLNTQTRTQELAPHYRLNGAIYIYNVVSLKEREAFFYNEETYAYEMDRPSSTDVDTREDFMLAKFWESSIKANS